MIFVSTACLKAKTINEVLKEYVKVGIRNIELSGGTAYYPELMEDLIRIKREYQVTYACHAYFPPPPIDFVVNLASCNDEIYSNSIHHYEECIKMLSLIDCKYLSVHAGFLVELSPREIGRSISYTRIYDRDESIERFCKAVSYLNELCKKNNILFYLENNVISSENYNNAGKHNYLLMTDYNAICEMRKKVDFNLLLDLGHLNVSSCVLGLEFEEQVKKLMPQAKWIHISENNGIMDEHRPLQCAGKTYKMLKKFWHNNVNVTLETNGSIDQICESIQLVNNLV